MHEYPIFIFAALLIFAFGLFSRLSERSFISAAMVFVSVGMVAGPLGLGFFQEGNHAPLVQVIVLTVLLSVFLHGITAVPLSRLYANRTQNRKT